MSDYLDSDFYKTSFKVWLRQFDIQITFTKVNGEERVMKCTLRPEALPVKELNTEETIEGSTEAITVWDLEKKSWRRFLPSNVSDVLLLYREED